MNMREQGVIEVQLSQLRRRWHDRRTFDRHWLDRRRVLSIALLDGGPGHDQLTATPNVRVIQ